MYKPMLARVYEKNLQFTKFPCRVQPKLDGVRLCWDGKSMWSRKGKILSGLPKMKKLLTKGFKDIPLDGELYRKGMHFQDIVSSVRRSTNIDENLDIQYHVYDIPVEGRPFYQRMQDRENRFKEAAKKISLDRFVQVETLTILDASELLHFRDEFIEEGYEGCMFRDPKSFYEFGKRSKALMKLKLMFETEGIVIDVVEGQGKYVGTLGALIVTVDGKIDVSVGTGFDDATRDKIWKNRHSKILGLGVTIKYQEKTKDGMLRFPVFKSFRNYE